MQEKEWRAMDREYDASHRRRPRESPLLSVADVRLKVDRDGRVMLSESDKLHISWMAATEALLNWEYRSEEMFSPKGLDAIGARWVIVGKATGESGSRYLVMAGDAIGRGNDLQQAIHDAVTANSKF